MASQTDNNSVITKRSKGWYVDIRCEGLKTHRYGPFSNRSKAQQYHTEVLECLAYSLQIDIPVGTDIQRMLVARQVGKVCTFNKNSQARETIHGTKR